MAQRDRAWEKDAQGTCRYLDQSGWFSARFGAAALPSRPWPDVMRESIGFVVNDAARLFRRELDRRIRTLGVTALQWRTLATIALYEGVIQSQLAEWLEVEPITLSRMIDRLAESGLVERRPHPDDRRANSLYLTATAQPLVATVRFHADQLAQEALEGLDESEKQQLFGLLARVRGNLSAPARPQMAGGPDDEHGKAGH